MLTNQPLSERCPDQGGIGTYQNTGIRYATISHRKTLDILAQFLDLTDNFMAWDELDDTIDVL